MAEFVDCENKEQGRGKRDALDEVDQGRDAGQRVNPLLHGTRGRSRSNGTEKQQQMDP